MISIIFFRQALNEAVKRLLSGFADYVAEKIRKTELRGIQYIFRTVQ